ncbi:MAG TPA: tyrosine-type recombinase/integrase [Pyrinomonadaceae bacterium]|jgi:site-specific recombinase XerD
MSNELSDKTFQSHTMAAPARFDARMAASFCEKSVSEETRRAYRRVVREFFTFVSNIHPSLVTPEHVLRWRETLRQQKQKAATISLKLSVVRSLFEFLKAGGYVSMNPASTRLVPPPEVPEELAGRALTPKEVRYLLSGPDRSKPEGARDYALLLVMLKMGLRVSEACSLRVSSVKWSHGRWIVKFKVKGGRERTLPLPTEVKKAFDDYMRLDRKRREALHSDGENAFIFQPHLNYRTLEFNKPLSTRMAWNIVRRWAEFTGIDKLSPHDLRRTAITKALDQGLSYRQVQMMSGHKDPKTVMRYDHGRENLEMNAINFLKYEETDEEKL